MSPRSYGRPILVWDRGTLEERAQEQYDEDKSSSAKEIAKNHLILTLHWSDSAK